MQKIPANYLTAAHIREARAMVREWLCEGLEVRDIAMQISERYRRASPAMRRELGRLLGIVYDFETPETAAECARLFGEHTFGYLGLNVSQSLFVAGYETLERLDWRNRLYVTGPDRYPHFDERITMAMPRIVPDDKLDCVYTLHRSERVYAVMTMNGTVHIFAVSNCGQDMLVDEEPFNDEAPMYFTESTHFKSPVYKVRTISRILEHLFCEVGFPYVHVSPEVIYTNPNAHLINAYDYTGDGEHSGQWAGIDIRILREPKAAPLYPDVRRIATPHTRHLQICELNQMLEECLRAAGYIYFRVTEKNRLLPTPLDIACACDDFEVFATE